jgi:glycosyltransferase involved in cell wall biosynthesis
VKILYLLDYAPRGTRNIDHLVLEYADQVRARGWEIAFAFSTAPTDDFARALVERRAKVVAFDHPLRYSAVRRFKRDLPGYRPDVIQTSFLSPFHGPVPWLKLSGYGRRLIVLDHSSGVGPDPRSRLAFARRVRGAVVGRIVDAIAPVSRYVAVRVVERSFLPPDKVITITNGLDLGRYPCPDRIPGPVVRIAFAGQLIPEKGVVVFLEALARLHESGGPPLEVRIAGQGAQRAELEAFCRDRRLEHVRFLGHIDSVPELFGWSDIAVVPSRWAEAFGYVAAEAMACGAAVIASDAGALPEVVGEAGLIFPSGDAADLAAKLAFLAGSPQERTRFRLAGRERTIRHYELKAKVSKHLALCEHVHAARGCISELDVAFVTLPTSHD